MRVLIRIKNVRHADLAEREHPAIGALRAAELIEGGLDRLSIAIHIDSLTHEQSRQPPVRVAAAHLISRAAGKPGDAECTVKTEALIDLPVDPHLGSRPKPRAQK